MSYTHHMFWLIGCTDSKGEPDSVLKCYNDKVWSIKCLADSPYCEQLMAWFVIWDFRVIPCNVKLLIALFLLQKNTERCMLVMLACFTHGRWFWCWLSEWVRCSGRAGLWSSVPCSNRCQLSAAALQRSWWCLPSAESEYGTPHDPPASSDADETAHGPVLGSACQTYCRENGESSIYAPELLTVNIHHWLHNKLNN